MLRVSEDGNRRRDNAVTSYRQIRQSLLDLQAAADRIFDTISQRTAKERVKLTDLSTRIQIAKDKIDAISHSKRSIKVTSPARYPTNAIGKEDFCSLFGYNDGASGVGFPAANLLVNGGLDREFGTDGTLELYQFFSETTSEFLPKEVHSKVGDHSKSINFSEYLVDPTKISKSSLLVKDIDEVDSSQKPKHQSLPPPPPSLLMHNSRIVVRRGIPKR